MAKDAPDSHAVLRRAAEGDVDAWGELLMQHQNRLQRMVQFRLDRRLQGRVDSADILQEAYAEAAHHRGDFFSTFAGNSRVPLVERDCLEQTSRNTSSPPGGSSS